MESCTPSTYFSSHVKEVVRTKLLHTLFEKYYLLLAAASLKISSFGCSFRLRTSCTGFPSKGHLQATGGVYLFPRVFFQGCIAFRYRVYPKMGDLRLAYQAIPEGVPNIPVWFGRVSSPVLNTPLCVGRIFAEKHPLCAPVNT